MSVFQDPEFWRRLSEAIMEQRQERLDAFELGRVTTEKYQHSVGYLEALRFVSKTAENIVLDMNTPKNSPQTQEDL